MSEPAGRTRSLEGGYPAVRFRLADVGAREFVAAADDFAQHCVRLARLQPPGSAMRKHFYDCAAAVNRYAKIAAGLES